MRKILAMALGALCLWGAFLPAQAAEVACDSVYCFSDSDFSQVEGLTGVCITGLPDPARGTVLLGTRVVRPGDILSVGQLQGLTFQPLRTESDRTVQVTYLPIYENTVASAATMTISIRGREDKAPAAQDQLLETYKNLPNSGILKATDPEGEALTFSIIRGPKRGQVQLGENGSFTYTPKKNKVGTDSFTYTATDPAGKVSRQATVTVQILKPSDKQTYTDTVGSDCRFAAEWMKHTGLFVGEEVGGQLCFQPDKPVNRGEFMAMLVKTLDIPVDKDAGFTGFTDQAPEWLRPYLAAALRAGLTAGWPHGEVFGAQEGISGAEAAVLIQNALDLSLTTDAVYGKENDGELPAWAQNAINAMTDNGFFLTADQLTRGEAAKLLYQVSREK